jgi:hypothetical protein
MKSGFGLIERIRIDTLEDALGAVELPAECAAAE